MFNPKMLEQVTSQFYRVFKLNEHVCGGNVMVADVVLIMHTIRLIRDLTIVRLTAYCRSRIHLLSVCLNSALTLMLTAAVYDLVIAF